MVDTFESSNIPRSECSFRADQTSSEQVLKSESERIALLWGELVSHLEQIADIEQKGKVILGDGVVLTRNTQLGFLEVRNDSSQMGIGLRPGFEMQGAQFKHTFSGRTVWDYARQEETVIDGRTTPFANRLHVSAHNERDTLERVQQFNAARHKERVENMDPMDLEVYGEPQQVSSFDTEYFFTKSKDGSVVLAKVVRAPQDDPRQDVSRPLPNPNKSPHALKKVLSSIEPAEFEVIGGITKHMLDQAKEYTNQKRIPPLGKPE